MPCYKPLYVLPMPEFVKRSIGKKNVDELDTLQRRMSEKMPIDQDRYNQLVDMRDKQPTYQKTRFITKEDPLFHGYDFTNKSNGEVVRITPYKVPCGRCLGCRLDYARAWANRCTMETIMQKEHFDPFVDSLHLAQNRNVEVCTWFMTFTYDDDHLPRGEYTSDGQFPSLCMKDFQDFLKRLRITWYRKHYMDNTITYYYCGEYGDHTARPHYHAIIWYLPIFDLDQYSKSKLGDVLFNSQEITSLWGKGHVVIAKSSYNAASYVARYCMKKQDLKSSEYNDRFLDIGIQPPYVRMSRAQGIGLSFYETNKDKIYLNDDIILPAKRKGETFKIKPPRIFDTKYAEEFPDLFNRVYLTEKQFKDPDEIKLQRFRAMRDADIRHSRKIQVSEEEDLINQEEVKQKTIMALKRML